MMTTIGKESIALMLTTTAPGPSTTTTTGPSTTTTTGPSTTTTTGPSTTTTTGPSTTTEAGLISLESIDGIVYGVYNTKINQNSEASTSGDSSGNYPASQSPAQACDGNPQTKYLSFGRCSGGEHGVECGSDTGFYLELKRGASLVTGLQICTGEDFEERDPLTVSLEGSNQSGTALTLGSSWTLIYNGTSGLEKEPDRLTCGIVQPTNNSIQYKSYRFLVSSKRGFQNSVQYSELKLLE
ncbi:unnamed protein product [Adineta steineri]|uniref:Uncharacterized protein n=1 Tax=Adineta steineri TaxID=433720 RepID=A0A814G4G8_9BILA|nr:unnamed protein product [Adineta steineri]CAF0993467.1 unnamed protein product [Adineta steineri]